MLSIFERPKTRFGLLSFYENSASIFSIFGLIFRPFELFGLLSFGIPYRVRISYAIDFELKYLKCLCKNERHLCLVTHSFTKLSQNVCLMNTQFFMYRYTWCDCKLWNAIWFYWCVFLGIYTSLSSIHVWSSVSFNWVFWDFLYISNVKTLSNFYKLYVKVEVYNR